MSAPRNHRDQLPRTHLEALVYFISRMDTEMVASLLDDDKNYEDVPKYEFLHLLEKAFDKFKAEGDTQLKPFAGECRHCYPTCPGQCFVGNNSRKFMPLVFEVDEEKVTDLCECSWFEHHFSDGELKGRVWLKEDEEFDIF
jgi:hypothetical protein